MTTTPRTRTLGALTLAATALIATACDKEVGVPGATTTPSAPAPIAATTSPSTTKTTSAPAKGAAQPLDYTRLLLEGRDISTASDTYTAPQPATANPGTKTGAEVLLVNQDQTKAVNILIAELPDPAAAPSALQEAQANLPKAVTGGQPEPSPVGTGGTVVSGTSPDGTKSVTVLLFTEGTTLARIEFDGIPGEPAARDVVTNVGQKQDIALRVGLAVHNG